MVSAVQTIKKQSHDEDTVSPEAFKSYLSTLLDLLSILFRRIWNTEVSP